MANQRLFPEPEGDKPKAKDRFSEVASKVFSTPKSDIDQRERRWKKDKAPTISSTNDPSTP